MKHRDPASFIELLRAQDTRIDLAQATASLKPDLPWLDLLADTEQDPEWHAEGDVATHTQLVLDEIEALPLDSLDASQRLVLRLSALLHDIAKPVTTSRQIMRDGKERVVAPRHAQLGASYLPLRLTGVGGLSTHELLSLCALVHHHHDPKKLVSNDAPAAHYKKLSRSCWARGVYLLEIADMRGRICADQQEQIEFIELFGMRLEEESLMELPWDEPLAAVRESFVAPLLDELSARGDGDEFIEHALYEGLWAMDRGELYTPHEAIARAFAMRERHTSFVLLCGPSGSGKSSYAARAFPDHDVISMDVLREELGSGREDQSVNGQVFQAALERLRQALRARRAVIWDATSLRYDTRRKLLSLAMDYGSHTTLITALTSPEALLKRNAEREHAVPKSVLLRQLDSFEWPRPEEAHRLIVLDDAGEVAWDSRASWSPAHR